MPLHPLRSLSRSSGGYNESMGLYTSRSNRGWLADKSVKEGGWQIEYGGERRRIHEIFEADLSKHGVVCKMKEFIPWCTGKIGPTSERET